MLLDKICQRKSKLQIAKVEGIGETKPLYYEVNNRRTRCYILKSARRTIFNEQHNLSHPGIRGTRKLLNEKYFWPNINSDCKEWTLECHQCQLNKVNRHTVTQLGKFATTTKRFRHVHMDLVGPLPPSKENRYILTMIGRFSRWGEAVPLPNMETSTVVEVFVTNWISQFGCPTEVTTDQGRQFESAMMQSLSNLFGYTRIRTTPYNPKTNGMVERIHRQLKAALGTHEIKEWSTSLPMVLLGLRATPKESIDCSPCEMFVRL